jgi:hypothetical protein
LSASNGSRAGGNGASGVPWAWANKQSESRLVGDWAKGKETAFSPDLDPHWRMFLRDEYLQSAR